MSRYRIGEAATALGVSVDTLRRWVDAGRIEATRTAGGHRMIDGDDLAAVAATLLADGPGDERRTVTSARNHLPGVVTRVTRDGVMAQVELQAGPHRIVSLMTREAADQLSLERGVLAVATVKSTAVVIERVR